jgi:hypothetical protein
MTTRFLITLALFTSAVAGVGAGALLSQVAGPDGARQDVKSITGVSSGVDGTQAKPPEKTGVDQITLPPQAPPQTDPARKPEAAHQQPASQAATIKGVTGTDGVTPELPRTVEIIAAHDNAVQSIRGIKGIDTVMLQNLEAVLRMQAPPPPPQGGGAVRAAAALLTSENDAKPGPETETDDRQELMELELEGS